MNELPGAPPAPAAGFFITPHGFGHASRASAVIEALQDTHPTLRLEIFTTVPRWYFERSVDCFGYHELDCDLGLVQTDALSVDIPATLTALAKRLPFDSRLIERLAQQVTVLGCRIVVCDIAPLGVAVAAAASIPSVLVENFTWDWIYRSYRPASIALSAYGKMLAPYFAGANLHIQTAPTCRPDPAALQVGPVSRRRQQDSAATRFAMGGTPERPLVLISMGGVPQAFPFIERLRSDFADIDFVIAGVHDTGQLPGNVTLLAADTKLHHPSMVHAADAVIGKVGYSTIAEVYEAGTPFGYFVRAGYPEMPPLLAFLRDHIHGHCFQADAWARGEWLARLRDLLQMPRVPRAPSGHGASQCAALIGRLL